MYSIKNKVGLGLSAKVGENTKSNKEKWNESVAFTVVVACLSLFALGWMDNARGPFFPLFLEATGESSSRGALFFALTSFVAILSSAVAGAILKALDLRKLLIIGGLAMGTSPFGLMWMPNLSGALVTALLFGLGLGWLAVGQNILISLVEDEALKKRLFSLLHCFYALAAMTAPLSIVKLKSLLPWNLLLIGVTVLTVPFLIMTLFLKTGGEGAEADRVPPPPLGDFWVMTWIGFLSFYVSAELIMSTRLVLFLNEGFGLSFEASSKHLFLFFLSMFCVRVLFFLVHFKQSSLKILMTCLLSALVFVFLGYTKSAYFFSLMGASLGPVFPLVMGEMSRMWPKRFDVLVSRAIALSSLFVVSAHMLVGKLTDLYGISTAVYSVPVLLTCALGVLTVASTKRQKTGEES